MEYELMIYQLKDQEVNEIFGDYQITGCPPKFIGKLDFLVWGKSANLWSLFTDSETGDQYRFSTFYNLDYAPKKDGFSLRSAVSGQLYVVYTTSKNNRCSLVEVEPLN